MPSFLLYCLSAFVSSPAHYRLHVFLSFGPVGRACSGGGGVLLRKEKERKNTVAEVGLPKMGERGERGIGEEKLEE